MEDEPGGEDGMELKIAGGVVSCTRCKQPVLRRVAYVGASGWVHYRDSCGCGEKDRQICEEKVYPVAFSDDAIQGVEVS
mgnify:FL=1